MIKRVTAAPVVPAEVVDLEAEAEAEAIVETELETREALVENIEKDPLQSAKDMAKEDPQRVANVVKNWVGINE
jgi:flagellar biosynthesis/type III secretory pathway M-ring protein FliF/YscJ